MSARHRMYPRAYASDDDDPVIVCSVCGFKARSAKGLKQHQKNKRHGSGQKRARDQAAADADSDGEPPVKRKVVEISSSHEDDDDDDEEDEEEEEEEKGFGAVTTTMDAIRDALGYMSAHTRIERRRLVVAEKMASTTNRINGLRRDIGNDKKKLDEMGVTIDNHEMSLVVAEIDRDAARAAWLAAEATFKNFATKARKIEEARASVQEAAAAAAAAIEGIEEFRGHVSVFLTLALSDAQGQPIDDAAVDRDTLLDAVAPDLRAAIDAARAAAGVAHGGYVAASAAHEEIRTELEAAEMAHANKRIEIKINSDEVNRLETALADMKALAAELKRDLKTDFVDAEANGTGAFAELSPEARALVREMRANPKAVADFGRYAESLVEQIPNALVTAAPLVLNDVVLGRNRGATLVVPENQECTICCTALANEAATDPVVCTPCNHFFHASCMNALFISKDANYERFVDDDAMESDDDDDDEVIHALCPVCRGDVGHTALCVVRKRRYFF